MQASAAQSAPDSKGSCRSDCSRQGTVCRQLIAAWSCTHGACTCCCLSLQPPDKLTDQHCRLTRPETLHSCHMGMHATASPATVLALVECLQCTFGILAMHQVWWPAVWGCQRLYSRMQASPVPSSLARLCRRHQLAICCPFPSSFCCPQDVRSPGSHVRSTAEHFPRRRPAGSPAQGTQICLDDALQAHLGRATESHIAQDF